MRTTLEPSVKSCIVRTVASAGAVLLCASVALAGPVKIIDVSASGQVFSRTSCAPTICQETHASGTSTVIGRFDAVLLDVVNFYDGTFTGTGVFTTPEGSTITTEYTGLVGPADPNGVSSFIAFHDVVAGTGKYEHASGGIRVTGTVDAALRIEIVGTGTLSK